MPRDRSDRSRRPAVAGAIGMLVGGGLITLNVATPPIDWLAIGVGGVIVLVGLAALVAGFRVQGRV